MISTEPRALIVCIVEQELDDLFCCEWIFSRRSSECFPSSNTRRLVAAKQSQVQDVRPQQNLLARFKGSFHFTSSGRCCEVSCFSWSVRDGFRLHLPESVACLCLRLEEIPPVRQSAGKRYDWGDKNKKRGNTSVDLLLFEHYPQTQLVTVTLLTRLWYKLINYSQVVLKGGGQREKWDASPRKQATQFYITADIDWPVKEHIG